MYKLQQGSYWLNKTKKMYLNRIINGMVIVMSKGVAESSKKVNFVTTLLLAMSVVCVIVLVINTLY
jgi:hypothetical protein